MERWKEYKFSDFVDINPTVRLTKGKTYSFVEMKDLSDGVRNCYPAQERTLSGGARFIEGDTLLARITPCLENGKIAQVKGLKDKIGFGSTEFLVFRGKESISNSDFVFYLSRWEEVRNFAENNFDGTSGRQRVPKDCFNNLYLELPGFSEQITIASILSSLDDKIDLLHRQNQTLEQMAETLFRQWFVEEAKEDWEIGTLDDEFEITMGQSPPGDTYNEDEQGIPFFQGRTDFGFRFPENRIYCTHPTRLAKKNDILMSVRAPVGDINMAAIDCCIGRGLAAIRYKHDSSFFTYSYYKVKSILPQIRKFEETGTIFGSISKNDLAGIEISLAPKSLIDKYQNRASIYDMKLIANTNQIRMLTQLRDTLLPKLMSGEVRVRV